MEVEMTDTTNITQIATVIVPVGDQDKALELYVGTLGFEVRRDMPFGQGDRWLEVAPPGAATTIALVQAQSSDQPVEISFLTGDVESDHAGLRSAGIDSDEEVLHFGGGVPPMFTFRDPDGNRFRVVQGG
jgi:catechol 2,3-dioxygenase-like lactoylglutathione lyase family enzyme